MPDSVAITEVIWTLIGLVGLYVTARNFRSAKRSLTAYKLSGYNGAGLMLANAHIRRETMRILIEGSVTGIGIAAMFAPPANPAQPITATGVIVTMGLFIINAATTLDSILDRRIRNRLLGGG